MAEEFGQADIKNLPHCFVHGDIIDTNVIRDYRNKPYILDFSVVNTYPRIQELAVMLCDILLIPDKGKFRKVYDRALFIYQEGIKLDKVELEILPLCFQAAHATHIIGSVKSAVKGGDPEENDYWMKMGRDGLKFTREFWN